MKNTFTVISKEPHQDKCTFEKCTSLMANMSGFILWSDGDSYQLGGKAEIHIIWSDDEIEKERRLDFYAMVRARFGEKDYPEDSNEIVDACMAAFNSYGGDMLTTFNNVVAERSRCNGK